MIARIWHGVTPAAKADEFLAYIRQTGEPAYRNTEGNCGVFILRRMENDRADFLLISLWDSLEAIRRFAGPDIDLATYPFPKDREFLVELEPKVLHYEIMARPE